MSLAHRCPAVGGRPPTHSTTRAAPGLQPGERPAGYPVGNARFEGRVARRAGPANTLRGTAGPAVLPPTRAA